MVGPTTGRCQFCGELSHVVIHTPKRKLKEIHGDFAQKDLFYCSSDESIFQSNDMEVVLFFTSAVTSEPGLSGITYQISTEYDCGSIRSVLKH